MKAAVANEAEFSPRRNARQRAAPAARLHGIARLPLTHRAGRTHRAREERSAAHGAHPARRRDARPRPRHAALSPEPCLARAGLCLLLVGSADLARAAEADRVQPHGRRDGEPGADVRRSHHLRPAVAQSPHPLCREHRRAAGAGAGHSLGPGDAGDAEPGRVPRGLRLLAPARRDAAHDHRPRGHRRGRDRRAAQRLCHHRGANPAERDQSGRADHRHGRPRRRRRSGVAVEPGL